MNHHLRANDRSLHRRDFLAGLGPAAAAALAMDRVPLVRAAEPLPAATADCVVLLWMAGGMAHTETFDPKHYEPFRPGIEAKRVLSTFPAIDTSADGIRFTAGLEEMASVMHEGTLVRTYTTPVTDKITHSKHQYHWHTGYMPPLSVAAPHIGAVVARSLGPRHPDVPAFIDIGETFAEAGREATALRSFLSAGFLGAEFGPFCVPQPEDAARRLLSESAQRRQAVGDRLKQFQALLDASPAADLASSHQQESMLRSFEQACRLMHSPRSRAFDIGAEPEKTRAAYDTGPFGRGCLLARRLVEAGARFIEVHVPYKPFGYWDTHEHGHDRTVTLKKMIDRPVAQLIRDLRARGLLDRTLVVLASEFSRDPLIEGKDEKRTKASTAAIAAVMQDEKHYGMHAHFADAGSVLLWGGGMKRGFAYGETADEHPCKTVRDPVRIEDLRATIYAALGIPPTQSFTVERRPFYVTKDGQGVPIRRLFA
jgi:uncharacterized protein (DUF1501 family)